MRIGLCKKISDICKYINIGILYNKHRRILRNAPWHRCSCMEEI